VTQIVRKNGSMYLGILLVWALCLAHFNPRLFAIVQGADNLAATATFTLFVAFLNLFWLYGIYHCFFWAYKLLGRPRPTSPPLGDSRPAAILYTVCNDFKRDAALACINQHYPDFHVYLLDDSTSIAERQRVDVFHAEFRCQTTVVRRPDRSGYKAGNLNHALRHQVRDSVYFAVIDADEVIPPDFLSSTIACFALGDDIAFVQANHEQNPRQPSRFADDLALGIAYHWNIYQPPRNDYGFVIFYGHGAVIRRDIWEQVGGFPEIVSEDLAFATRVRQHGYRGYFLADCVCYEDFPETFPQFRTRHEKWVKGVCQYFHTEFVPFFVSPRVTWPEKADVLMSCVSLFLPALFLIFVFTANAALPLLLAERHTLSVTLFGWSVPLMPAFFMEALFKDLWTPDFYLITLVGMFAPVFVYLGAAFRQPGKIFKLLFKSAVPYISLIVVSAWAILGYLFTREAQFTATGDKALSISGLNGAQSHFNANHPWVFKIETLLGLALTYLSFMTVNFALLSISTCLLLSPVVARVGWDGRLVSVLVTLPLAFALLAFASMGVGFMGMQGFSLFFLALHF